MPTARSRWPAPDRPAAWSAPRVAVRLALTAPTSSSASRRRACRLFGLTRCCARAPAVRAHQCVPEQPADADPQALPVDRDRNASAPPSRGRRRGGPARPAGRGVWRAERGGAHARRPPHRGPRRRVAPAAAHRGAARRRRKPGRGIERPRWRAGGAGLRPRRVARGRRSSPAHASAASHAGRGAATAADPAAAARAAASSRRRGGRRATTPTAWWSDSPRCR